MSRSVKLCVCRLADDSAMPTPSSWDSTLSGYSLESALVDLPAVPDPSEKLGRKLKSENSFGCDELDSMNGSLCQDPAKDEAPAPAINSKPARDHSSSAKASLADRYCLSACIWTLKASFL